MTEVHVLSTDDLIKLEQRTILQTYARYPVALARGSGVEVWDVDGKRYLDFLSGIAVNCLGHSHPAMVAAMRKAAEELVHTSNLFYTEPQLRLAEFLLERTSFHKVFFCNSGAEANEAAIKLARRWGSPRFEIITAIDSFHGRTLGALSATGQPKYREPFEPLVPGFKYVPFGDLNALRDAISATTCAVLLEPIQGEAGVHLAPNGYFTEVRRLCTDNDVLLILDEIQTGLGRTGRFFAYEHFGIEPDIVTSAKALAGGLPMGAMLAKEHVASSMKPGDHGSTFGGGPFVAQVALAVLQTLLDEDLIENADTMGRYAAERLRRILAQSRINGQVRGLGLLLAIEFENVDVRDLHRRLLQAGLITNAIGDRILRLAPPLIVSQPEIDEAVEIMDRCVRDTAGKSAG
jgi:predicted acetylornithine/succinylornithine family transaminase